MKAGVKARSTTLKAENFQNIISTVKITFEIIFLIYKNIFIYYFIFTFYLLFKRRRQKTRARTKTVPSGEHVNKNLKQIKMNEMHSSNSIPSETQAINSLPSTNACDSFQLSIKSLTRMNFRVKITGISLPPLAIMFSSPKIMLDNNKQEQNQISPRLHGNVSIIVAV